MKARSAKAAKVNIAESKSKACVAFIGVKKAGSKVTVSREILRNTPNGQLATISSKKSKLPKQGSAGTLKSSPKDWMRNPQLGDRLRNAFGKAVAAAKRSSAKSTK